MIDTIILRVHNLKKNVKLLNNLENNATSGYDVFNAKIPSEELAEINRKGIKKPTEMIDVLKRRNKNEFLIKQQVLKHMNLSSHYLMTYFVNYTKDFIEFNFSLPKYKFGTNILLYIRHITDKGYIMYNAFSIEHNMRESYRLLLDFLKKFFHWEFIISTVDFRDVEINRIDLCFNQVFRSKDEALLYLEYQKRLKKKYARDEAGVMREYATSIMYVTKRYSAKIYHKGTEYEVNDKKEHLKINKQKGKEYFKTEKFQKFADRILRYEITIRNPYLNYLHKNHIFRKKCIMWQTLHKFYLEAEVIKQRNERISKKIGSLVTEKEKNDYRTKYPYSKLSDVQKSAHKIVSKIISRRRYFKLDISWNDALFNMQTIPQEYDDALFSEELFKLCMKKLMEFVKEFQIKELPNTEIIKQKIEEHNKLYPSKKLPLAEMMNFYDHILKHGSFKDAAKFSHISRATLYRHLTRFAEIGITDKAIKPADKGFGIPNAPLNLREYHCIINYDSNLLRGINITEVTRM